MIDVFTDIYDKLRTRLKTINVGISTGYQISQSVFPHVTIDELSNIIDFGTLETDGVYADNVSIEINIYSNSKTPRKEIKPIIEIIDNYLTNELGTNRNFTQNTPNYDSNIYRYTMRYNFIIDKNLTIYRR